MSKKLHYIASIEYKEMTENFLEELITGQTNISGLMIVTNNLLLLNFSFDWGLNNLKLNNLF